MLLKKQPKHILVLVLEARQRSGKPFGSMFFNKRPGADGRCRHHHNLNECALSRYAIHLLAPCASDSVFVPLCVFVRRINWELTAVHPCTMRISHSIWIFPLNKLVVGVQMKHILCVICMIWCAFGTVCEVGMDWRSGVRSHASTDSNAYLPCVFFVCLVF